MAFLGPLKDRMEIGKNICVPLGVSDYPGVDARRVWKLICKTVEATAGFACAFKLEMVVFESLGADGPKLLRKTISLVKKTTQHIEVPTILDAGKESVDDGYLKMIGDLGVDAVILRPFLGLRHKMLKPLFSKKMPAVFLYCPVSPQGGDAELTLSGGKPFYRFVAEQTRAEKWNDVKGAMPAIGTADPRTLREIRGVVGVKAPILVLGEAFREASLRIERYLQKIFQAAGTKNMNGWYGVIVELPPEYLSLSGGSSSEEIKNRCQRLQVGIEMLHSGACFPEEEEGMQTPDLPGGGG